MSSEKKISRSFGQLRWALRQRGFLGALRAVVQRLRHGGRKQLPQHPFDLEHGTDTSGLIGSGNLRSGHAHDVHSTAYFGTPPSRLRHAVARWQQETGTTDLSPYTFFDAGCGKGRALMVASALGFREVAGVELNADLVAIARANLALWREKHAGACPATVLHGDASEALLPAGPLLLFLYNPFGAPVLRELLRRVAQRSMAADPPLHVLYLYPEHEAVFEEFPQFVEVWSGPIPLEAGEPLDGVSSFEDPCSLYRLTSLSAPLPSIS